MAQTDVVLAVAGGTANFATAGGGLSLLSAAGQTVAGVISAVAPIGGAIAVNPAAGLITLIKIGFDSSNGIVNVGDAVSIVGNSTSVVAAICAVVPGGQPIALGLATIGRALQVLGIGLSLLDVNYPLVGPPFSQEPNNSGQNFDPVSGLRILAPGIYIGFQAGLAWFQRRDPLILDLDGDGIELTASNSAVLFDHNSDTLKTGTQWAKADDGILVRDLNGNGTIDSGRELFGDQTQITTVNAQGQSVTTLAANGFQALSALDKDANGMSDGVFDANDVAYSELRIWRDLNQDGVSQSNELLSLAESGVSAINLVQTPAQITQGKSTFTKTVSSVDANGNPVTTTTTQTVQNVNLTQNTFYREFTDSPAVTASAALLPQMQGAGQVRDLREAMSLLDANGQATAQATALQTSLEVFKGATNAKARQDQADAIITAWANTSSLPDALARNPIPPASAGLATWYVSSPGQAIANFAASNPALYKQLTLLERFNGQAILERYARPVAANYYDPAQHSYVGYTYYAVSIEPQRLPFFQSAYDSLKASTYQSLYLQTAGKALLDQVELVIDPSTGSGQAGLRLGFDALNASFQAKALADANDVLIGGADIGRLTCRRRKFSKSKATKLAAVCACSVRAKGRFDRVFWSRKNCLFLRTSQLLDTGTLKSNFLHCTGGNS